MIADSFPVCLCLTGKTLAANLAALDEHRQYVDLVELRADCLDPSEKFLIRSFPEKAGLPCILTVRRKSDGGCFVDGEGVRLVMIAKALSFASSDARANFAYADLESDFHMATIEDACRTFGTRIIRSVHYTEGIPQDLDAAYEALIQEDDEIPKLAVRPRSAAELSRLVAWASGLPKRDRLILGMGDYGFPSRILASRMGSLFCYTSLGNADMPLAAPGQTSPESFVETYRGRDTKVDSDLYALLGDRSILSSLSPSLHNTAFRSLKKDALLVPMPSETIEEALENLGLFNVKGAAITVPHKEAVLPYLSFQSTDVQRIGACNTLVAREGGWAGYNTDADGFERSVLEFLEREDFKGMKVTLIGAGGAAKSVALSLFRRGAECVVLNRTISTARALARKYGFIWGPLDDRAIEVVTRYSDLIVQATSLGMKGGIDGDPLEFYEFDGHEKVYDLIYKPSRTALLVRAEEAGCRTANGYTMLRYQAAGQYKLWMGELPPSGHY
ncbi:MAG: type I 3-dehydroquinate dehydratase [Spirochaetia bacterium]|jgi:3-dehydroquinate dehydratase/shikimate dehydrogenase|uniref:Shikimate dehydrogenase (NADP(+)) n=1 Tax=bioreactor metagenome TaxID=1076179 RepID=A0A644TUL4_9ZZZZ|nr:type I 3-dehydroquinate dehydratase [Spirochaetia bacterium]MCE1208609.1 type I 3-dehydroquinate dehydratase [Spirochaetia bacterium]